MGKWCRDKKNCHAYTEIDDGRNAGLLMYYDEYFPFHAAYANPLLYDGERIQDEEFELMKSYYPDTVRRIQERVEEECSLLDYEGSRLYDEYPDKYMLYHLCRKIREEAEPETEIQEAVRSGWLDELVQVLLYQEISRRRCKRQRCRRVF